MHLRVLSAVFTTLLAIGWLSTRDHVKRPDYQRSPQNLPVIFSEDDVESPTKLLGERLFRETRFSRFFFDQLSRARDYNGPVLTPDPIVDKLGTFKGSIENPYRKQSISCANCHLVGQAHHIIGGGSRAYTDFAPRSPLPSRKSGTHTPRNSLSMVGSLRLFEHTLHADGEFESIGDLVRSTFMGPNLGWNTTDAAIVKHHVADVLRNDDGHYPTDAKFKNLSYRQLFWPDDSFPEHLKIDRDSRLDLGRATDEEIFSSVVTLLARYASELDFSRDERGVYTGSPFDLFLFKNSIRQTPNAGQSPLEYTVELDGILRSPRKWKWVDEADGRLILHDQQFRFGNKELRGFLVYSGRGRCLKCHAAPDFTDRSFHNTGVTEDKYDRIHGAGRFTRLDVPNQKERLANPGLFLPETRNNPGAQGIFRRPPEKLNPRNADLGVWNTFLNPYLKNEYLNRLLRKELDTENHWLSDDALLGKTIGLFRTPSLRDLGQTNPYFHNGSRDTITDVLLFYKTKGASARRGEGRNLDSFMREIRLSEAEMSDLDAFLRSLNEDYK